MTLLDEILGAAHELARAARWSRALRLLDAADGSRRPDRERLALAAAEIALDSDWFAGTDLAAARLAACPATGWDAEFLRLRHGYQRQLSGGLPPGPGGTDPAVLAGLRRQAGDLSDRAPDPVRRGWARMYLGLILDNLLAERSAAPAHYAAALAAADADGSDLLGREALRHLGDHDRDNGEHATARARWERATELGARAGLVPGVLSQQLLLAVAARDAGDEAGARLLAGEVARWAQQIGTDRLHDQALAFLDGA